MKIQDKKILTIHSDEELNAAMAEYVAGWKVEIYNGIKYFSADGQNWIVFSFPPFATSADAVLPLLETFGWRGCGNRAGTTCAATVVVNSAACDGKIHVGQSDYTETQNPFPRAACIALLRAKGFEVVMAKEGAAS